MSFRKSVNLGFGKLNFSPSGTNFSFGPKGAKINTGPLGTYVNFNYHGIRYHKKIVLPSSSTSLKNNPQEEYNGIHTITSASIQELTDIDSKEFIQELTEKSNKISYFLWFAILPGILFVFGLFLYFYQISKTDEKKQYILTTNSAESVNVRQLPNKNSKIFGTTVNNLPYNILDTNYKAWYKIIFNDSVGFVSKQFSHLDSASSIVKTYMKYETDQKDLISCISIGAVFFTFIGFVFYKQDRNRLTVEIFYNIDDRVQLVYTKFITYFKEAAQSQKIWQYLHSQATSDYKHHAGASKLINRIAVNRILLDKKPARFFSTNIPIPNIKLRNTDFYFFPERIIVKRNNQFAAVFYKNIRFDSHSTKFIEEGGVPSDSEIVDYTWKYLNKNGSPDKRFNNNRKLPICLYSEYVLSSETGIYEILTTSKRGAFDNFSMIIKTIGNFQQKYIEA